MSKEYQVVRYKSKKDHFEVLVKPETVPKYREGKLSLDKVLYAETIFKKHQKGEKATKSELESVFGEISEMDMIKKILEDGEYQESTKEKKEKMERRRREIINYLHKYYIDPTKKCPHPVTRLEGVLDNVRFTPDPHIPLEKQVQDIMPQIIDQIPMKRQEIEARIKLKHAHLGAGMSVIRKYTQVSSEKYDHHGCNMLVSLVPGDYDILMKELNRITKGDFEFNIEGGEAFAATNEKDEKKKAKQRATKQKNKASKMRK